MATFNNNFFGRMWEVNVVEKDCGGVDGWSMIADLWYKESEKIITAESWVEEKGRAIPKSVLQWYKNIAIENKAYFNKDLVL